MTTQPLDDRGLPHGYPLRPDIEITPRQTRQLLGADPASRPLLVDCRRDDEWEFCRIEGAVHLPMEEIERRVVGPVQVLPD